MFLNDHNRVHVEKDTGLPMVSHRNQYVRKTCVFVKKVKVRVIIVPENSGFQSTECA